MARAKPEMERGAAYQPSRRSPEKIVRARELRHGKNQAEATLWNELKAKKLGGYKFVRQMPIGPYFADFACRGKRLIVEIDGSQHAGSSYDRQRDEFIRGEGFSVCETILAALEGRLAEDVAAADFRFVFAARKIGDSAL